MAPIHVRRWIIAGVASFLMVMAILQLNAQVPLRGQLSDFIFPNTDEQGRKTVLKGTAKTLPNGLVELSPMTAETYEGDELDITIQAPHCLFNPKTKTASSSGQLSVRTANERFAIQGKGFRWQQTDSRLSISNEVHSVVRKTLLAPRHSSNRPAHKSRGSEREEAPSSPDTRSQSVLTSSPADQGLTASSARTNSAEVIEITSDQFDLQSALAQFRGHVRARQTEGKLDCGLLRVHFKQAGGQLDRVEAEQEVRFEQGDVRATGDRALYRAGEGQVSLQGNTSWKAAEREGTSQMLHIDDKTRSLRAERDVKVKLLPDKVLPLNWFTSDNDTNAPTREPQPITIAADLLAYTPELAVFRGNVRVADEHGSSLTCGVMTNLFSGPDSKLTEIIADENVEFRQGATFARSDRAIYAADAGNIILTGQPQWKFAQGEGSSGRLIIHPNSKQIEADHKVTMKLLQSDETLALDFPTFSPRAATADEVRSKASGGTNRFVEVAADELYYKQGSAIFLNNIRVLDPNSADRTMRCEVLAAFFGGSDNKLDQLIAEQNLEIQQGESRAYGSRAVQWVSKGVIELTGDEKTGKPVILEPKRKFTADRFVIDRKNNSFRMVGNYHIEMERTAWQLER